MYFKILFVWPNENNFMADMIEHNEVLNGNYRFQRRLFKLKNVIKIPISTKRIKIREAIYRKLELQIYGLPHYLLFLNFRTICIRNGYI